MERALLVVVMYDIQSFGDSYNYRHDDNDGQTSARYRLLRHRDADDCRFGGNARHVSPHDDATQMRVRAL